MYAFDANFSNDLFNRPASSKGIALIRRLLVIFCLVVVFITSVGLSLRHVVHNTILEDAEHRATRWTTSFVSRVPHMERISETGQVSPEQLDLMETMIAQGGIFRFKLFSTSGELKFVYDETGGGSSDEATHSQAALDVYGSQTNSVTVKNGRSAPNRPDTYVEAYLLAELPSGVSLGIIEVYVDASDLAATLTKRFRWFGLFLVLGTAILFLVPSIFIVVRNQQIDRAKIRVTWLDAILNHAPFEVVIKDTQGRIQAISRNVTKEFNLKADDFFGKTTADFLPDHIAKEYMEDDDAVVKTGLATQKEVVEKVGDATRYKLSSKFPLSDSNGRVTGVCSITNDITGMRESEEMLSRTRKLEAIGQLTGGIAHDFNNLLAVVQGSAEFLQMDPNHDEELVDGILHATKRGAKLTHRLLAYSRKQPLTAKTIDVASIVLGAKDLLCRTLGETIEIETKSPGDLWLAVADPNQVEDALLNLVINARDAMPRGGKLIIECSNASLNEVDFTRDAILGDFVVLSVSDTGEGMSETVQAQAIEPFFTTKAVGEGSGLGLSIVYGFAKQSGGHVNIKSKIGKGTTIKVFLPRGKSGKCKNENKVDHQVPFGNGQSVMVIEDDPIVRKLAARTIFELGYVPVAAEHAAEARTLLNRGQHFDVILSDVVLPKGVSGPEFAMEVRAQYPDAKILFMSGYPSDSINHNELGGTDTVLLTKPFQRETLARALQAALRTSVSQSEFST
jgi:PAS domain S-box-containing protein